MFDTLPREASIQAWLDEADARDAELRLVVEETAGLVPREPSIPSDLAEMEPGIVLAAVLSSIDIDTLTGHDRVIVMAAHQRMASEGYTRRHRQHPQLDQRQSGDERR